MIAEIPRTLRRWRLPRIVQLTNKSNQFNLTTRRYTQSEMEQVAESPNYIRLYGRLRDKFGDNGIVSVVIGEISGDALHIDLWLMSCRVLKRDMELAMLDELVEQCRTRGIRTIYGYYYQTAKNAWCGNYSAPLVSPKPNNSKTATAHGCCRLPPMKNATTSFKSKRERKPRKNDTRRSYGKTQRDLSGRV